MNIDTAFPSKYLKAADLPEDGTAIPFKIEKVETEEVGRDKNIKPVIYFAGQEKGLVANKTNCNTIAKALGSRDTEDWIGKSILLYSTEVQFGDEMVESIRVKVRPAPLAPPLEPSRPLSGRPSPRTGAATPDDDEIPFN